jgi:hypothetical protein
LFKLIFVQIQNLFKSYFLFKFGKRNLKLFKISDMKNRETTEENEKIWKASSLGQAHTGRRRRALLARANGRAIGAPRVPRRRRQPQPSVPRAARAWPPPASMTNYGYEACAWHRAVHTTVCSPSILSLCFLYLWDM